MQIPEFMNQLMALLSLYSEVIAFLVAASVLSLVVGWQMKSASAKRKLNTVVEGWEKRFQALDATSRTDSENLEEQMQSLASEAKTLHNTNKVLTDSLKKNDTSIQKARAEAIELNRQHAETQERLQRIIQQKEREIAELGNRISHASIPEQSSSGSTHIAPNVLSGTSLKGRRLHNSDLNHADTIAINPADPFDATVQMAVDEIRNQPKNIETSISADAMADTLEDTADLSNVIFDDLEESTLALDDEALAFAQRSYPSQHGK